MGLISALGRGARGLGRGGKGLAQYLGITGGIGAGLGAGLGAGIEAGGGGNPWDGARDGAINGAMMGPVTVPAMALGAATGAIPVAGGGVVAHTLASASEPEKRARARESLEEADAFAAMIRQQQQAEFERMMQARFPWLARESEEQR